MLTGNSVEINNFVCFGKLGIANPGKIFQSITMGPIRLMTEWRFRRLRRPLPALLISGSSDSSIWFKLLTSESLGLGWWHVWFILVISSQGSLLSPCLCLCLDIYPVAFLALESFLPPIFYYSIQTVWNKHVRWRKQVSVTESGFLTILY